MIKNNSISREITVFHERIAPEKGLLVGYGALIDAFKLKIPMPARLAIISTKHKQYETSEWLVFTPRHTPNDTIAGHLTFAIKYEGVHLLVLKKLFETIDEQSIIEIICAEPTGAYSRRIWFLHEWLLQKQLAIADIQTGNFVDILDNELQYTSTPENSKRHRVRNNLPGVPNFCPLVWRTPKLENYIQQFLATKIQSSLSSIHRDVLLRASAFLLLKDSKASFAIEGENPPQNRAQRWARAIGQAGARQLSESELLRLQQIVIESDRFTKFGFRTQEGFIGEHDRETGTPIPSHISAKWSDVEMLMNGLIETTSKLEQSSFDAVLSATIIAFGFVFIHPFVDGNGRLHRFIIHHLLSRMKFAPSGMVFPVSSAMLNNIDDYRKVLEDYSLPVLECIDWKSTTDNNVEIANETIDFYRYFDATKQAEFLYSCVNETIETIIPEEVKYLQNFDQMKNFIDNQFEMPDKTVSLLIHFLDQGNGKLSKRTKEKEFNNLSEKEIEQIEMTYNEIFNT